MYIFCDMPTTWFSRQQPICFVNIPVSFRDCQKAGAVIKENKLQLGMDGWDWCVPLAGKALKRMLRKKNKKKGILPFSF